MFLGASDREKAKHQCVSLEHRLRQAALLSTVSIHTIVREPVQTILLFSGVLHALHDYHGGYYAAT